MDGRACEGQRWKKGRAPGSEGPETLRWKENLVELRERAEAGVAGEGSRDQITQDRAGYVRGSAYLMHLQEKEYLEAWVTSGKAFSSLSFDFHIFSIGTCSQSLQGCRRALR